VRYESSDCRSVSFRILENSLNFKTGQRSLLQWRTDYKAIEVGGSVEGSQSVLFWRFVCFSFLSVAIGYIMMY
jgi:hypothetical protein